MRSFNELLKLHEEIIELFLKHQYALRRMDWGEVAFWLKEHEKALLDHMRDEEDLLIPLYAERCGTVQGGAVELFLGEHKKLCEFLDFFKEALPQIASSPEAEKLVIQLFDREATYKRLLGHHDIREEKYLYPLLDKATTEEERTSLLDKMTTSLSTRKRTNAAR